MKSFMVGAMLLRTMNAQVAPAVNAPAPLLTPANLAGAVPLPAANPIPAIPTAIRAPPPAAPWESEPAWLSPVAQAVKPLLPVLPTVPVLPGPAAPALPVLPSLPGLPTVPKPLPIPALPAVPVLPKPQVPAKPAGFGALAVGDEGTPLDPDIPLELANPVALPLVGAPVPIVGNPIPLPAPIGGNPVPLPAPIGGNPVPLPIPIGGNPVPLPFPIPGGPGGPVGPYDPNSIYDPTSPNYNPYFQPPGWQGDDNNIYDGEDDDAYGGGGKGPSYGDDYEEECPAWCLEHDSYPSYPTSTPKDEYKPYKPDPTPDYPVYTPEPKYPEYKPDPKYPEYTPEPKYPEYKPEPKYPEYDPTPEYPTSTYEDEYPTPTPDYPDYTKKDDDYPPEDPKYYPQVKKVRNVRRQGGLGGFNWPQAPTYADDDSGDYDAEDGSIPDWLYSLDDVYKPTPKPQPKPKCPKSCYKKPSYGAKPPRPTYTKTRRPGKGYPTTVEDPYYTAPEDSYYTTTEEPYYPTPTEDIYDPVYTPKPYYPQGNSSTPLWPTSVPDDSTSVPDESTSVPDDSTSVPDESTSVPSEPTYAPTEPTTLVTQYQPQPYPEETGAAYPYPSSGGSGDYTGDSLANLCPNVCNPFNPAENFCENQTTGCTTTGGSKYYCACRAGYRADNYNAKDFSKQFKVPGQPYVYLAVKVSCNTLCSDNLCSEVMERPKCL